MATIKVKVHARINGAKEKVDGVEVELLDAAGNPFPHPNTTYTANGGKAEFTVAIAQQTEFHVRITDNSLRELMGDLDGNFPDPEINGVPAATLAPQAIVLAVELEDDQDRAQVVFKLVPAKSATSASASEKAQFVAEVMTAAAQGLVQFVGNDPAKLDDARVSLRKLFCGNGNILSELKALNLAQNLANEDVETLQYSEQSNTESTDESGPAIDVLCTACYQYYNTPGTAYYRNYAWLQGCLYNPPCG